MVSRRENMKRYIKVITNQLPKYILKYSTEDQLFLNKFIEPLRFSEEANYKRNDLARRYREVREFFIRHEFYISSPFFWFVDTYFENAEVSLRSSSFHADLFYDYLLPILRGTAGQDDGVFQLLKDGIPLTDFKWENLQYKSAKLHIPLKSYELDIIKAVYAQLRSKPLNILKPRRVRSNILSHFELAKLSSNLPKLFTILNSRWTVWPNYPAFGIQSFFFHFHLSNRMTLDQIIDFQAKSNGILTTSSVYSTRGFENQYLGIMHIPEGSNQSLFSYLEKKKEERHLSEILLVPITENRWTYSLAQYQTESGWQTLNRSSWMGKVRLMKLKALPRRRKEIELEFVTPSMDQKWNFRQLDNPHTAIELVCKKNIFEYSDLLSEIYTPKELDLLNFLIKKKALFIDFFPYRLGAEYSLDYYLVEIPRISFYQLKRLLELIPSTRIASTSDKYYIFAYLSPTMVQQINTDLEWSLYSLLPTHTAAPRTLDMFNMKLLKWQLPKILAE